MALFVKERNPLPPNIAAWKDEIEEQGVSGVMHETILKLKSASKFEYEHFLALRILWRVGTGDKRSIPTKIQSQFTSENSQPDPEWSKCLDSYLKEAARYVNIRDKSFLDNSIVPFNLGPFVNVCQFHKHVAAGDPTKYDKVGDDILITPKPPPIRPKQQTQQQFEDGTPSQSRNYPATVSCQRLFFAWRFCLP